MSERNFHRLGNVVGFWSVLTALCVVVMLSPRGAFAENTITVGYYPGWPTTQLIGQAKGWFSKEMGVKVEFRQFQSSSDMAVALASGSAQIVYSLGIIPLVQGVSTNVPYRMVGVAVSYEAADNCVARDGTGIKTPRDLVGRKVGVPFSSVSQYKLLKLLNIFGVNPKKVDLYDMTPPAIVAAFKRKDIDAGCAWEPSLSEMLDSNGHLLVTADTESLWGLKVFDTIDTSAKFAKQHPGLVRKFLTVVDKCTRFYKQHHDEAVKVIGKEAGLSPEKTANIMSKMHFPMRDDQISSEWMGTKNKPGAVPPFMKQVAEFLHKNGKLRHVLNSYRSYVHPEFYEKVTD